MRSVRSSSFGFTVVELMVAVAILGIISAIAAPAFNSIIQSSKISASADELLTLFQLARSESVKRVRTVVVCPSADGVTCQVGTVWSAGAIVQVALTNGNFELIQVGQFQARGITATGPEKITFNSVGSATQSAVTVTINGGTTKIVCLAAAGRATIYKASICP